MIKETKSLRERVVEQEANAEYYGDPLPAKNIIIGATLALGLLGAAVYGLVNLTSSQPKQEIRSQERSAEPSSSYQKKSAEPSGTYQQNEANLR